MRLRKFRKLWLFFVVAAAAAFAAQAAFAAAKTFNNKDPNDITDILQETAAAMSDDPSAGKPSPFLTTHDTHEYDMNSLMVLTLGSKGTGKIGYYARSFDMNRQTSKGGDAGNGKLDADYNFTEVSKTFGIPAVVTKTRQAPLDDRGVGSYRFAIANFGDATKYPYPNPNNYSCPDASQLWIGKITKDGSKFGIKQGDFKKIALPSDPNNRTFDVERTDTGSRGASDICTVDIPGVPGESFVAAESVIWSIGDNTRTFSQRIVVMRGDAYDDQANAAKTAFYYPTGNDKLTGSSTNPGMRLAAGDFDRDGVRDEVAGVIICRRVQMVLE
ncbi:hypothetical protein FACS1894216_06760 [Synergistales bacterium]|nr:hypothetical protein FACS1894216_06760 [Synergistales bacterium]